MTPKQSAEADPVSRRGSTMVTRAVLAPQEEPACDDSGTPSRRSAVVLYDADAPAWCAIQLRMILSGNRRSGGSQTRHRSDSAKVEQLGIVNPLGAGKDVRSNVQTKPVKRGVAKAQPPQYQAQPKSKSHQSISAWAERQRNPCAHRHSAMFRNGAARKPSTMSDKRIGRG